MVIEGKLALECHQTTNAECVCRNKYTTYQDRLSSWEAVGESDDAAIREVRRAEPSVVFGN